MADACAETRGAGKQLEIMPHPSNHELPLQGCRCSSDRHHVSWAQRLALSVSTSHDVMLRGGFADRTRGTCEIMPLPRALSLSRYSLSSHEIIRWHTHVFRSLWRYSATPAEVLTLTEHSKNLFYQEHDLQMEYACVFRGLVPERYHLW